MSSTAAIGLLGKSDMITQGQQWLLYVYSTTMFVLKLKFK